MLVQNFLDILDDLAPFSLAADWDNVGLMLGSPLQEITGVLVGLDPDSQLFDEAVTCGLNTILTHHPLIFHGLKSIRTDQAQGRLIQKALGAGLNIIACHTNLDVVEDGVSHCLAAGLGLQELVPLVKTSGQEGVGFGRVGLLPIPLAGHIFMERLREMLGLDALAFAGRLPTQVSRVAVCGGSGSDLAEAALSAGVDLYITAELKHATAIWAVENNFCIVDGSHFATENIVVPSLASRLQKIFVDRNEKIKVKITSRQKNPISLFF